MKSTQPTPPRSFDAASAAATRIRFQDAMDQIRRYLAFRAAEQEIPAPEEHPLARGGSLQLRQPLREPPLAASFAAVRNWYGFPSGGGFRPPLTRPDFLPDFLGTGRGPLRFRAGRRTPVPLPLDQVAGRVLAQEIRADRDQPPFPRATRDGFACRAAEANTHRFLLLTGRIRAGQPIVGNLEPGEAWEIMTGAPLPPGADAVLMVEHCEQSSNCVRLVDARTVTVGENIVPQAAEAHAGDLLVPVGVRLGASQVSIAAQNGYRELSVARRPRVAILTTGDELVPVDQRPGPSQIRNSNASMLAALVTALDGEPLILPAAADHAAVLDESLRQAMTADLLLISGGISVGRFDLVEESLTRAGARFFFGGVAIQPGKPVAFGQLPRADSAGHAQPLPFLALPGNPISSTVTFHLFGGPLIAGLAEDSEPGPRFALAQLTGEWRGRAGLTRFLPASCDFSACPQVRLVPWQSSGDLAALARSNCFVAIDENAESVADGSIVPILLA